MTLRAFWPIVDESEPGRGDSMTVVHATDVDALVTRLAEPDAATSVIYHEEPEDEDDGSQCVYLHAAIQAGYGYLSAVNTEAGVYVSRGEADSPGLTSEHEEWPPGSGVAIETMTAAIKEFLPAGRRPTGLDWQAVD